MQVTATNPAGTSTPSTASDAIVPLANPAPPKDDSTAGENEAVPETTLTPTTTTLQVDPNPVPAGSQATLTATVAPNPASGHVQWLIDGVVVDETLVGPDGTASTSRTIADPGTYTIQAQFIGDTLFGPSLSSSAGLTVSPVSYSVTLVADPSIVVSYETTHLTATVEPGTAGTLQFFHDDALIASQEIAAGGSASLDPVVPEGASTFRADFVPNGAGSAAGSASVTVEGKWGTTLSLISDRTTAVSGETVIKLTATPESWGPTGSVTFRDITGATPVTLGKVTLTEDANYDLTAVLALRLKGAGVHTVDAVYGGDDTYAPATATPVTITLSPDIGVSASGVGVNYSTFYPYRDDYRDTVAIRGTLREPASVHPGLQLQRAQGPVVLGHDAKRRVLRRLERALLVGDAGSRRQVQGGPDDP